MPRKAGLNARRAKKKKVAPPEVAQPPPLPASTLTRMVNEHFPVLAPLVRAMEEAGQPVQVVATQATEERVPDSPGFKQWREAELAAQLATNKVRIARKDLCESGHDFMRASEKNRIELERIARAQKRKLSPHKILNRLWNADSALRDAERKMLRKKYDWAAASHDAQVALNAAQVVRIRRLKRFLRSAKKSELQKVGS